MIGRITTEIIEFHNTQNSTPKNNQIHQSIHTTVGHYWNWWCIGTKLQIASLCPQLQNCTRTKGAHQRVGFYLDQELNGGCPISVSIYITLTSPLLSLYRSV